MTNQAMNAAVMLAPVLGGKWIPSYELENNWRAELHREDGLRLSVTFDSHAKKFTVRPCLPNYAPLGGYGLRGYGLLKNGEDDIRASFSPNRTAGSIAGDIQRKVIARYEPLYQKVLEKIEADKKARAETLDFAERLAMAATGTSLDKRYSTSDRHNVYIRGRGGFEVLIPSGAVWFKGDMTQEQALKVAAILKDDT